MKTFLTDLVFRPKRFLATYLSTPERRPYYRFAVAACILSSVITDALVCVCVLLAWAAYNEGDIAAAIQDLAAQEIDMNVVFVLFLILLALICFSLLSNGLRFALMYWMAGPISRFTAWILGGRCTARTGRSVFVYLNLGGTLRLGAVLLCVGSIVWILYKVHMYNVALWVAIGACLLLLLFSQYVWFVYYRTLMHVKKGRTILLGICTWIWMCVVLFFLTAAAFSTLKEDFPTAELSNALDPL